MKVHEFHARKFLSHTVDNGEPSEVFNHHCTIFDTFLEANTKSNVEDEFTGVEECEYQPAKY